VVEGLGLPPLYHAADLGYGKVRQQGASVRPTSAIAVAQRRRIRIQGSPTPRMVGWRTPSPLRRMASTLSMFPNAAGRLRDSSDTDRDHTFERCSLCECATASGVRIGQRGSQLPGPPHERSLTAFEVV
jgi:hypothetical protein